MRPTACAPRLCAGAVVRDIVAASFCPARPPRSAQPAKHVCPRLRHVAVHAPPVCVWGRHGVARVTVRAHARERNSQPTFRLRARRLLHLPPSVPQPPSLACSPREHLDKHGEGGRARAPTASSKPPLTWRARGPGGRAGCFRLLTTVPAVPHICNAAQLQAEKTSLHAPPPREHSLP
jgi:hypothetical protein